MIMNIIWDHTRCFRLSENGVVWVYSPTSLDITLGLNMAMKMALCLRLKTINFYDRSFSGFYWILTLLLHSTLCTICTVFYQRYIKNRVFRFFEPFEKIKLLTFLKYQMLRNVFMFLNIFHLNMKGKQN